MPKVKMYGGPLGITLPAADLEALDIKQGDEVEVRRRGSILEVIPIERRPKLRPELQTLFDQTKDHFGEAMKRLAK